MKLISWNLLHSVGAELGCVAGLIEQQRPDVLLMQEATTPIEKLASLVGGVVWRTPLPDRIHGLAIWTPHMAVKPPTVFALPDGAIVKRVCQHVDLGTFGVANVHLSHGQLLNRRQLRTIAKRLPDSACIVGDFNIVGPALLPDFDDIGPRGHTHRAQGLVKLRLDRCLARNVVCSQAQVLARGASDHHPIMMRLEAASQIVQKQPHRRVA